jgi:putative glutamine amidotransferase
MKLIAITQRVDINPATGERRDALDQCWTLFLQACGYTVLVIPNQAEMARQLMQFSHISGVLLTGGNDLAAYGGDAPERDETELALIDIASTRGLPVLGVCRGMQLLQHHAGVKLQRVTGHVGIQHTLKFDGEDILVNSFHNWGATSTVPGLEITAVADDLVIEAVVDHERQHTGIMWHPEREAPFLSRDIALVQRSFLGMGSGI